MNFEESSLNQLDIAFIADDSRQVRSQSHSPSCSMSMASQVQSISAISGLSRIYSGENSLSMFNDPSISGMEQWNNQPVNIFGSMKRKTRAATKAAKIRIQPGNIEEQDLQCSSNELDTSKLGQCSKKRLCEKMKLITINDANKSNNKQIQQMNSQHSNKSYVSKLRSRSKTKNTHSLAQQNDSSLEEIQEIVRQLGSKKEAREYYQGKPGKK